MTNKGRLVLVSPLLLLLVLGCQTGNPETAAKMSGKVTYNEKPVTGGTITFQPQGDGRANTFPINPDGTYNATDMPAVEMVVTVDTESLNPDRPKMPAYGGPDRGNMASPPPQGAPTGSGGGAYVKIPAKYADKATSGLKATLTAGKQSKDFPLTD